MIDVIPHEARRDPILMRIYDLTSWFGNNEVKGGMYDICKGMALNIRSINQSLNMKGGR